ncbi:uncharacterized protein PHACADRAFT_249105 [Phanerochaete carnosa HHB-10118-sp]|uniref:Uncharacterized protein n=1 Tax=Phanerochaete carnosa (strain HHB-10118-sp) TaxID=650164 RepID=K5W4Z7_PHACS|nr:uncharacterized protein PHACADRAFT_249105 [Phanerochaete carnosa HHB-10118-sp]EKM58968.1 hypothetical protein PHACADRAFT_249105 [Phanerochaete carnosa HHB-10118-sp]
MCDLGPKLTFDLNHPRDTLAAYRTVLSLRGLARDLYNSANSRAYTLRQPFSALHQWRADTFNFLWPTEDTNSKISRWLEQSIPPTESEIMAEDLRRQLQ